MLINRSLVNVGLKQYRLALEVSVRLSSTQTSAVATKSDDEPGYFQKLAMRLNGIPLKGETHPPKSMFEDCDKEFVITQPLPTVPKDYKEYPERDLVNYPYPERHLYAPKTRLFMISDAWCKPFEKVTGTSGPYVFFGGLAAFLVNKEIFVVEENAMKLVGFATLYWLLSRTVQYRLDKYLVGQLYREIDEHKRIIDEELKDAVDFRKTSAAEKESLTAVQETFPIIFKENLALQLEAVYRKNVNTVATELKRRLDYLQEVEATKLRFERDVLLKSITEGVQYKIATNEGNFKDLYLDNCVAQLKMLAK